MIARVALIGAITCGVAGFAAFFVPPEWVAFLEYVRFKQLVFGFLLVAVACLLAGVWYLWRLEVPIRLFAGLMTTCAGLGVGLAAARRLVPTTARLEDVEGRPRVLHVEFERFDCITLFGVGVCLFFAIVAASAAGFFFWLYHPPAK